jgi:N-formylglutamate deformylase
MNRLKNLYGYALLFDAHSIRSELPWLFEGKLPDLNLGTAEGRSCDPAITEALGAVQAAQQDYTQVVNGRFKGGFITRHYGQPANGWHAVQLEMCQSCYMSEVPPYAYDEALAARVQPLLRSLLSTYQQWKPAA